MSAVVIFGVSLWASQVSGRGSGTADPAPSAVPPLQLEHTIALPGVSGRFDHFACDAVAQRLVVAALGNNTAEVIDLENSRLLKQIRGLRKPTGVLVLAQSGETFIANGDDGSVRVFDPLAYDLRSSIGDLDDADNLRFGEADQRVYVGFGAGALAVIDLVSGRVLDRIRLAGHPESFHLEAHGPRIFVNVPDANEIAVVDRTKGTVIARWPMNKWQSNFPMALDERRHRLYVGCRRPARLVVFDTEEGKPVSDIEISADTDDVFFDPKRQRIYVSGGEGFIDVVAAGVENHYERTARIATREGARTSFFSPYRDRLYLAVPKTAGRDAEIRVYQPQ